METFSEIKTEINDQPNSLGTWYDVSADVLADPAPHVQRGIMGNGIEDRIADVGTFNFSLDNSEGNSHLTRGYWSILGPDQGLPNLFAGCPVRLSFVYDGVRYYKFLGRIAYNGVNEVPGIHGVRRVDITCIDYIGYASSQRADFMTPDTNKRIEQAVQQLVTQEMTVQPNQVQYATGLSTFPYIFDLGNNSTTILSEFQKLAMSELGYIYVKGDKATGETLVVENRTQRYNTSAFAKLPVHSDDAGRLLLESGDYLLLENGSKLILEETQNAMFTDANTSTDKMVVTYGKHDYNYVKVSITPRKIDAAATTILWTMQTATSIAAGATISNLVARYRDPAGGASYVNGREWVTPVANTDYKANTAADGTGTDRTSSLSVTVTFGGAEALISLTNNHGTDTIYVGGDTAGAFFKLRGKGIYIYDSVEIINKNAANIGGATFSIHQLVPIQISMPYQSDISVGTTLAGQIIDDAGATVQDLRFDNLPITANLSKFNMFSFLALEPGDAVNIIETLTDVHDSDLTDYYFINGYTFDIQPGGIVEWNAVIADFQEMPQA